MSQPIDLTGQKFGRFVVIKRVNNFGYRTRWLCRCDCGQEKIIRGSHLRSGNTKSCGCLQIEKTRIANTIHGHHKNKTQTKIYRSWNAMLQRCLNPDHRYYCDYGGRGIKVCQRWRKFENFLEDMGRPPTKNHSIDRIDNNQGYCKSNCRWTTKKQQQRNKRNNIFATYKKKTQLLIEWAEELDISYHVLWERRRAGWPTEKSFTTPVKGQLGMLPL